MAGYRRGVASTSDPPSMARVADDRVAWSGRDAINLAAMMTRRNLAAMLPVED
jgi:hypothetical protein